jgi:hypothetical protein
MPATNIRRRFATVVTLSAATFAITVPSAYAAGRDAGSQKEYFQLAGVGAKSVFIAHGAITGGGTDDMSHEAYDILHLSGGTLRINHPDKDSKTKQHVDKKTCYATFDVSGKYTISNGTGKYEQVTGHGTYRGSFDAVLKRNKNGSCNENAEPTVQINAINASGPLSL